MPWGMSRAGTREQIERELDTLRDTAKSNSDATEAAMVDAATEMVRATIALAGTPVDAATGQRAPDTDALQYNVNVNTSGHVAADGGTNLYMSVTVQPQHRVGALPDGPTPNELAAAAARDAIAAAAERAAPMANRPTPGSGQGAGTGGGGGTGTGAGTQTPGTGTPAVGDPLAPANTPPGNGVGGGVGGGAGTGGGNPHQ